MKPKRKVWDIGDRVEWWQKSEWDENVPRLAKGVVEKAPKETYNGKWVRDLDTNDCLALDDYDYRRIK